MFSEEILYALALRQCPMVGDVTFRKLVAIAGSAKDAWELSKKEISSLSNIRKSVLKNFGNLTFLRSAEEEIEMCIKNDIDILYYGEDQLPGMLKYCDDAPILLFKKGTLEREKTNLSIVGTRALTHYGKKFLMEFLSSLKDRNIQTISGLALGADTAVHEYSLENRIPTVAVVAHSLHTIYPSKNRKLAQTIIEQGGCLLSEYGAKQAFIRENFIQRNRIIAGISATTIVVETAFGGGSMSTANFANIYNRDVLALPGNFDQKYSQGCNKLIAENKARTIVDIPSTLDYMGLTKSASENPHLFTNTKDYSQLTIAQNEVMQIILKMREVSLDDICDQLDLPIYQALPILLELELKGFIQSSASRKYSPF